jgi:hypothetical protein
MIAASAAIPEAVVPGAGRLSANRCERLGGNWRLFDQGWLSSFFYFLYYHFFDSHPSSSNSPLFPSELSCYLEPLCSLQSHILCLPDTFGYLLLHLRLFRMKTMGADSLPNGLRSTSETNGFLEIPASEKWIVQKFGGTSVGKFPLNIVDDVVRRVFSLLCHQIPLLIFLRPSLSHGRVAIVCSARSSSSKADGTTNR